MSSSSSFALITDFDNSVRPPSSSSSSSYRSETTGPGQRRCSAAGQSRNRQPSSPKRIASCRPRRRHCSSASSVAAQSTAGVQRQLLRAWLMDMADRRIVSGLEWLDPGCRTLLKIPWRHGSRSEWTADEDGALFTAWALHKGKYGKSSHHKPKDWKRNFRCALNSLRDVEIVTELCKKNGPDAYVVYRFLPEVHKGREDIGEDKSISWCPVTDDNKRPRASKKSTVDQAEKTRNDNHSTVDSTSSDETLSDYSTPVLPMIFPADVFDDVIPRQPRDAVGLLSYDRILPPPSPSEMLPPRLPTTLSNYTTVQSSGSSGGAIVSGFTMHTWQLPITKPSKTESILPPAATSAFSATGCFYNVLPSEQPPPPPPTAAPIPIPVLRFHLSDDDSSNTLSATLKGDMTSNAPRSVPILTTPLPTELRLTIGERAPLTSSTVPSRVLPKLPSAAKRFAVSGKVDLLTSSISSSSSSLAGSLLTETTKAADAKMQQVTWSPSSLSSDEDLEVLLNTVGVNNLFSDSSLGWPLPAVYDTLQSKKLRQITS